jgi:hypothetical protein
VGRLGLEPRTNGLTYHYSFRYQIAPMAIVCGLDFLFTSSITW